MRPIAAILEKAYPSVMVESEPSSAKTSGLDRMRKALGGKPKTLMKGVHPTLGDAQIYEWKFGPAFVRLTKHGDAVEIAHIKTVKESQGRGHARAALQRIISAADTEGIPLMLHVEPSDGTNLKRLLAFYESMGFTQQQPHSSVMWRNPKNGVTVATMEGEYRKSLLLEEVFTAKDIDLDKTYGTFKASYEKQTGKAWDKEKFLERIQNWTLYGDHDGFVAGRKQASGPIKLVGAAGNPIGVKKGFQELLAQPGPVWGAMDLRLATMAARMGMKMPPAWIMTKVLSAIKDKFAAASGLPASAVTVNKDGSLTIDYPDVGKATKFVVGNKSYFEWLLKTQGAAIPAMLRTAISYFLTTGKPPPEPKDQDDNEAFALDSDSPKFPKAENKAGPTLEV